MWCSMCPFFVDCEDPAKLGGGCDCDGADDFGVDPIDDYDDEPSPDHQLPTTNQPTNQTNQQEKPNETNRTQSQRATRP